MREGRTRRKVEQADESNAARATTRNGGIDLLRGWAVLSVILLHLNIRVPFADSGLGRSFPMPLSRLLFWSGYWAVMVFFVISGFLITSMTESRWGALTRVDIRAFYRVRFARIAPMLALFVIVQSVLQLGSVTGFSDPAPAASLATTVFSVLTFHLNWLEAKVGYLPGAWDVLWSLCVEELFYLGFPLLARFARPRFVLYAALLCFAIAGPFARVSKSSNEMWQDHSYLSCMGEIAIGCLAALLARRYVPAKSVARLLLFVGASSMALVLYFRHVVKVLRLYEFGLNVTLLSCGTAAVLIALSAMPTWARVTERGALSPLRWLGRNSYELYLSHLFVVVPAALWWKRLGSSAFIPLFYGSVLVVCALLGEVLARGFSKPLSQRLRPPLTTVSMPTRREQNGDQRADCQKAEGHERNEAAGGAELGLHLASDARAERDTFGKTGFAAPTHRERVFVPYDGLDGQTLAVRGDAVQTTHRGADSDDLDQAGREFSDLEPIADHSFGAHRSRFVLQEPQAILTRAVNELRELTQLALGERRKACADAAHET